LAVASYNQLALIKLLVAGGNRGASLDILNLAAVISSTASLKFIKRCEEISKKPLAQLLLKSI
jgi:hypothetical protein